MSLWLKIRTVLWGKPAETKTERRLIFKIDIFILSYVCLMYWVNYLDRSNLNNAYVSGMREDLHFRGDQLNVINTIFYAGYCVGQIPNNLIMQRVPPRIWLPVTCVIWGLLTLGTGFTHHVWQVMVLRFFQAIFESSTFVGTHWILGSWYKPEELNKRTAIFTSCGQAGTMFSGFIQGGIYRNLSLAGWRWLFVIDFLITLPIALYGYLMFPDIPKDTKAWYINEEERQMAVSRLPPVKEQRGVLGWKRVLTSVLGSWHWWVMSFFWTIASNTEMYSTNAVMNIWLSDTGVYTTEQVDYIPTAVSAVGIIGTLAAGWYTDIVANSQWHVCIFLSFTAIISGGILLNPPSLAAKFFAFMLNGVQYASQTTIFAWANELCRDDDAKRTIVLASMNMFATAVFMFWSILFYKTTQAPNWFVGSVCMVVMGVTLFFTTFLVQWLGKRDEKKMELLNGEARASSEEYDDQTPVSVEGKGALDQV